MPGTRSFLLASLAAPFPTPSLTVAVKDKLSAILVILNKSSRELIYYFGLKVKIFLI
jgi:hypothetical protein